MQAAAKHLTPVTLELGGKSPCIVDFDINIKYAARRITWGKFINAGQTCVAPDYLLVDKRIKQDLLDSIKKCIREFYSNQPLTSPDYARIINQNHFLRLVELLKYGEIMIGGEISLVERYIAPTVIERVLLSDPIMQDEIFGPILPVVEYEDLTQAIAIINERPKPWFFTYFLKTKTCNSEFYRKLHLVVSVLTTVLSKLVSPLYRLAVLVIAALVAIMVKQALIPFLITKVC